MEHSFGIRRTHRGSGRQWYTPHHRRTHPACKGTYARSDSTCGPLQVRAAADPLQYPFCLKEAVAHCGTRLVQPQQVPLHLRRIPL